jgi:nucleoside permease NupC
MSSAIVGGIIATVIAFLSLPAITKSSLAELGYWFDFVSLFGMASMYGVVAAALIWPLSSPKAR